MTTAQLVSELAGDITLSFGRIRVTPGSVYRAGTLAQDYILKSLHQMERSAQLALVAGQDRYQFPPHAVTGGAALSPATLTVTAHPFNTGDEVYVSGVVGLTGVNGERTVTKVDANTISLDGTTGGGAYTSGGTVYHLLNSAINMLPEGCKVLTYDGEESTLALTKKTLRAVDMDAGDTAVDDEVTGLVSYWEELTNPITVGFAPIPAADALVVMRFYRKTAPYECLSASVDPILPADVGIERALTAGARYFILEQLLNRDVRAGKDLEAAWAVFQSAMGSQRPSTMESHRSHSHHADPMRW